MARSTIKLTQKFVDGTAKIDGQKCVAPTGVQGADGRPAPIYWWDSEIRGFGVRCSGKAPDKSYVVQRALRGKERRFSLGNVNELSLEEARERAGDWLQEMKAGRDPRGVPQESDTLEDAVEAYVSTREGARKITVRTAASYRDVLRYFPKWKKLPLAEITSAMVAKRHAELTKDCGPYAANGAARVLRAVCLWRKLPDPTTDLEWNAEHERKGQIKDDDMPDFWDGVRELESEVHAHYVEFLLLTGMRRRAAASLKWSDVDWKGGVIRVPRERMKGGRHFDLPITSYLRDLLCRRAEKGRERFIFPADSKSGHVEEPKFAMRKICEASGVLSTVGEQVTLHDLRRTYINAAQALVSYMALKALVHHSTGGQRQRDVTAGYVHLPQKKIAAAAECVAEEIARLAGMPLPTRTELPETGEKVVPLRVVA